MIKVGITGSISSGKSTVCKIISKNRGPIYSADKIVAKLYKNRYVRKTISKKLAFSSNLNFKKELKKKIIQNNQNLKKLEKIIHPLARKAMLDFSRKQRNKKFVFFEIPLLVEKKLTKFFHLVILVKSKKKVRFGRYKLKGGSPKLFSLLDKQQLSESKKSKFCDHIIVNNKSLLVLKKNISNIIKKYE